MILYKELEYPVSYLLAYKKVVFQKSIVGTKSS